MRLEEIKQTWRPWKQGGDNTDANIDIPLAESAGTDSPTPVMQHILETEDDDFGPAMTLEEARAWLKKF